MSTADDKDCSAAFHLTVEEARVANIDIFRRSGVPNWSCRLNWVMALVVIAYGFIYPLLWHTDVIAWKIELLGQLLEASLIGRRMLIPSPFVTPQGRPAIRAIMNTRS